MKSLVFLVAAGLLVPLASPASAQTWRYSSRTDQFSDARISTASGMLPNGAAGLVVRCSGWRIEAFYTVRDYLDNEGAQTRYRIDGGEVVDNYWDTSTDGGGVFSPEPGIFARRLAGGNRVVIQAEKYNGTPVTYTFSLSGSAAAINRVLSDCGLPVRDPAEVEARVWPRVVQSLDVLHPEDVTPVQEMLNLVFKEKPVSDEFGRKGISTYERLSAFYESYWTLCPEADTPPSSSCGSWLRSRKTDPDANYPKEAVELLVEFFDETAPNETDD